MFAQYHSAPGTSTVHWNTSPEQQQSSGKSPIPQGDGKETLFQRIMEGSTTQAINAVALIAPEEIIRKLEQKKRRTVPSVFLARNRLRGGDLGTRLSRFGERSPQKQKASLQVQEKVLETKELKLAKSLKNIFGRFCGLIVNSEHDLSTLEKQLTYMTEKDSAWHPAQLYLVQVRVSHLSQKIEFFTSLMNKALESSKQIMNTQI